MTHARTTPTSRDRQLSRPPRDPAAERFLADIGVGISIPGVAPCAWGAPPTPAASAAGETTVADSGLAMRAPLADRRDATRGFSNRLLCALDDEVLAGLRSELELVTLEVRDVLFDPEQPIAFVYFPESAVLSLVSSLRQGGTVEVGTVGREGMVGLSVFLAGDSSTMRAIAQIPGTVWRMDASRFSEIASVSGPLHRAMLRYTQAFLTQVAQTAACNGAHLVVQRCARWLLMTHDRVQGDELELTHEFLAFMLGVRRAGVTVALQELQQRGLIRTRRGHVVVADREGLEEASCECYQVVREHFDRALGVVAS